MNKKVLVTAGPTQEAIDPVRFIGNHSSGKMGYAIAKAFADAGAQVVLVSGPVSQSLHHPRVEIIRVVSAAEMYAATRERIGEMDIAVFAAAVADYTPAKHADRKIKRTGEGMVIEMKPTVDIAATLGKEKRDGQVFVGFALETDHAIEHGRKKLERKGLDLIVINTLEDPGAGFGTDTNKITMMDKSGLIDTFELKLKEEVAYDIVEKVRKLCGDA